MNAWAGWVTSTAGNWYGAGTWTVVVLRMTGPDISFDRPSAGLWVIRGLADGVPTCCRLPRVTAGLASCSRIHNDCAAVR